MKPSICLIVGDRHTPHCGVKDYAIQLGNALETAGFKVKVFAPSDWSLKSFLLFSDELRKQQFDILHLQYPSIGTRHSLFPHIVGIMGIAKKSVVTLHEYSALPLMQRASAHLFRWTVDEILFTADAESKAYRPSKGTGRIIRIGSNIPAFPAEVRRCPIILYFGQIRPNKGLEEFLELARNGLQNTISFQFKVLGSVPPRRVTYYESVRKTASKEVEWLLDLSVEKIAELMASSFAAYLPYPDGASYRRGSLISTLTNSLPTITTIGPATSGDIADVVLAAASPSEALAHLLRLSTFPAEGYDLGRKGKKFAQQFSWTEIARQHEQLYLETLSRETVSCPHA